MTVVIKHPAYQISVGNAYFADVASVANGVNTYGTPYGVESIKSVGLTKQKAEQTIHASGITYEYASKKSSTQIALGAVALPAATLRKYLGNTVSTNKGFGFETADDTLPEFAFGYTTEYSNGDKVFKWYPRCKLIAHDPSVETSTDTPTDPNLAHTILAMPYGTDRLIEVSYDQSEVDAAKVPYTEDEFFTQVVSTKTDVFVDAEDAVTP